MSAYPPGSVPMSSNIGTTDVADTFPTHLDYLGYGGMRVVADNTARDAITSDRRAFGMLVYSIGALVTYQLSDISMGGASNTLTDNANWLTFIGSGAGITTLNGLNGVTQTFAVGTTGTDFAISSTGTVHTFNIPTASATNRGLLSSADWSTFNAVATGGVTQESSGTQTSGNLLYWTGTAKEASKGTTRLSYDTTSNLLTIGSGGSGADRFNIIAGDVNILNGILHVTKNSNACATFDSSNSNTDIVIITGTGVASNGGLSVRATSAAWTTGNMINADVTSSSATLAAASGSIGKLSYSLTGTHTSGTKTMSNSALVISATMVQNGAGGTLVATGDVVSITGVSTQTAGTLTDNRGLLALYNPTGMLGDPLSITQNNATTTNYAKQIKLIFAGAGATTSIIWQGNGTDPNGVLSGTAGDILINGASNKPAYCTGGTVWVNFV